MSRTEKEVPREVLADRGQRGWRWEHYSFPVHDYLCCCGRSHGPFTYAKRMYWKAERARVRDDLRNGLEPEPSRPRGDIQYNVH